MKRACRLEAEIIDITIDVASMRIECYSQDTANAVESVDRDDLTKALLPYCTKKSENRYQVCIRTDEFDAIIESLLTKSPKAKQASAEYVKLWSSQYRLMKYEQLYYAFKLMRGAATSPELLALSTLKRSMSLLDSFDHLIKNEQYYQLMPLIRMQIDSACRVSALFLVDDMYRLAEKMIFEGKELRKMKSRDNKQLTDGYLVRELSIQYPRIRDIYRSANKSVHLSDQHVWSVFTSHDEVNRTSKIIVSESDYGLSLEAWRTIIEEMVHVTKVLHRILEVVLEEKDTVGSRNSLSARS